MRQYLLVGLLVATAFVHGCGDKGTESRPKPPSAVIDLSAGWETNSSLTLTWTAPGVQWRDPAVSFCDVRYALAPITTANWASATRAIDQQGAHPPPENPDTYTVTGLSPFTTYYFAMETAGEDSAWSAMSNVASARTLHRAQKIYGGPWTDSALAVAPTADGGCIIVGCTLPPAGERPQVCVIKTDASGDIIWDKVYAHSEQSIGRAMTPTTDGGYVVVGTTQLWSTWGMHDVYVIKIDEAGTLLWERTFGESYVDEGNGVAPTEDGGVVVTGETWTDDGRCRVFVVRIDAVGNKVWEQRFSNGYNWSNRGNAVTRSGDGGFVVAGYTGTASYSIYHKELYLLKTDGSGNLQWEHKFGSTGGDEGFAVIPAPDDGFVVAGKAGSRMYLLKVDASGNRVSEWSYERFFLQGAACIAAIPSGVEYLVGGYLYVPATAGIPGHYDIYLVKTSGGGVWTRDFAWGGPNDDAASGICHLADGGYMVVGTTNSYGTGGPNIYLMKIDENGDFWE